MRIITGRFGRRKLLTNPGLVTRPITDRIKESLFNFLDDAVVDARIADVFAGTGTLGLEALSRGAVSVVFFEKDRRACDFLFKNIGNLKVNDEVFCWATDVTRTSFRPKDQEAMLPYDIVFFDPPYKMVKDIKPGHMLYRSLTRLGRPKTSSENSLLVFRTPKDSQFEMPPCWSFEKTLEYSTMDIHWYRSVVLEPEAPEDNQSSVDVEPDSSSSETGSDSASDTGLDTGTETLNVTESR
jgi:16S rRNA (guanine966-N2)-methyltransferase